MAKGHSLADPGSLNYAKLRWRDPNAHVFLRALGKAMQHVFHLASLIAPLWDKNHVNFQDLDALLRDITMEGRPSSQLLFQDSLFLDHYADLLARLPQCT